ncbi:MAG: ATP-binding protein, partial [Bacteroidota bacterium]
QFAFLTTGETYSPPYSNRFPAEQLTTMLTWSDLVLPINLRKELEDIKSWAQHGPVLLQDWGLERKVKKGYRALFHGPPGTGKTLTATLLGQAINVPVYRVDLSMMISKYIGETEKNLKSLFDRAENKNWILFFDEADALFGRRTVGQNANDRFANQQVAYLLQRIENYNGLIILSSNLKEGMDEAFSRRFESVLFFPKPDVQQRLQLWEKYFTDDNFSVEAGVDFGDIAEEYEVTGGDIIQILKFCSIRAISRNTKALLLKDIREGIKRAYRRSGKSI